jgi:cysteinyl-tRNA synthetase
MKKEEFKPIDPPNVSFYVCGPTVYDFFHIGNGRSFFASDMIRRYLTYKGYNVKFIMNLTDVDDKIIKKANEENSDPDSVAVRYIDAFFDDIKRLNVIEANAYPKATEYMADIIDLIGRLISNGSAYEVNGDVFYDVATFDGYGKLSKKNIEELESGARVEINEAKKNPLDFSLWKKAKEGEPSWDSPWGKGRPGWHIECSAMSTKLLGETIDIHAGGSDLIFPHHENEIAQSEAVSHKQFVKYWVHFGFMNMDNEKMSKSLGNFFRARDILDKYPGEVIRLLFCQTHYRGPMNFSNELLSAAKTGFEKLNNFVETLNTRYEQSAESGEDPDFDFDFYRNEFEKAMDDDFNSPKAVAVIFDFIREINKLFAWDTVYSKQLLGNVKNFFRSTAVEVLGIYNPDREKKSGSELSEQLINILIDLRLNARREKNFALADKIRDELSGLGIVLKDGKSGTTFSIKGD